MQIQIPDYISIIMTKIQEAGYEVFIVGGCVRDSILGKSPYDWDITTSAMPMEIMTIFSDKKLITTGLKHGTVTVIWDSKPVEITTYRIDGEYSDNRHPQKVTFSKNITEDLKRRDFTVNAMAYNPQIGLCDPYGGESDLSSGIIRAVGCPQKRFQEDALRIMRALRFASALHFRIDSQTAAAIFNEKERLSTIAEERITEEFSKLLTTPFPSHVLTEYFSVTGRIFWGTDVTISADTMQIIDKIPCDLSSRLSTYLYCVSHHNSSANFSYTETFFSRMKFSNRIKNETCSILHLLKKNIPEDKISLRKILKDTEEITLNKALRIKEVMFPQNSRNRFIRENFASILRTKDCYRIQHLNITGLEISQKFGLAGKEIGDALNFLLDAVIEEKCSNKKESLLNFFNENRN